MNAYFPPPSDDELHGFLDGELQPDRRSAIETFLKTSPIHAERVEEWRRQRQIIRATFSPVEAEPAPARLLLSPPAGRRAFLHLLRPCGDDRSDELRPPADWPLLWRKGADATAGRRRACATALRLFAIFVAGALAALGGAFFADRLHAPPTGGVRPPASVSTDDSLASRTIAALVDFKPQDRANALETTPEKSLASSHQTSLVVPNLSSAGFMLAGMRAAPALGGEPTDEMFCLFYAKPVEPAVALCIARDQNGARPSGFRIVEKLPSSESSAAISWRQANAIYTLAGPLDEIQLRDLANRISAEIEAFD